MLGVLLNNQWSVGGNPLRPAVNTFLAQPFVNYNMAHGWYLTSSPVITANWLAASGEKWTVPIGGGFGRLFKVGDQPVNAQIQAFYNVERPTDAATWQLRAVGHVSVPGELTGAAHRSCPSGFAKMIEHAGGEARLASRVSPSSTSSCMATIANRARPAGPRQR